MYDNWIFTLYTYQKLPKQGHVSLTLISLSKNKEKKIMKKKRKNKKQTRI